MTNRFLISVAAVALIAGTGFANAQNAGASREAPAAGSTAQQQPSSERGAAKSSEHMAPKGSDTQGKAADSSDKAGATSKSAQDNMQGQKSKSMSSENDATKGAVKGGKDMNAETRDKSGSTTTTGQSKSSTDKMNAQTKNPSDNMNAQTKSSTETKPQTTTGNAATSATAAPPPEKRTQIVTAIKSEKIEDVGTNVNFNLSIGATVPASVRFHPLPPRIVEIYPEWRGYEVIRVHGRYVIVRPETHEIVYIIEG
jgi:hypothetical protein